MLCLATLSLLTSLASCPAGTELAEGQHRRLLIDGAPVHLWCRTGSSPRAVVLYVHGYYDTVDTAFSGHRLAEQFAASGVDALFVAVEAPSGPAQPVFFPSLDALLVRLGAVLGGALPEAVLLVGHSGGNRTLKAWLDSPRANEVVLLDGFYGDARPWRRWLEARKDARLRLVGQHTREKADLWRLGLPARLRARTTQAPARCSHMEVVTKGEWLPRAIRESSLASAELSAAR
ncbi:MAG: hypothetical protein ACOZQL_29815 [Myxococcota bacterium]